jgi:outer membrane receptor protein involved in Fe transport
MKALFRHSGRLSVASCLFAIALAPAARSQTKPARAEAPAATADRPAEVVELSPFQVTANTKGYYSPNTMSGTRLNTSLDDLASSISVVTKEQMEDFAMVSLNDIFAYEANTEGTGNFTNFDVDRRGNAVDGIVDNPEGSNRIRGMGAANAALGNFSTSGRMPTDPSTLESVEISRGPNSNIFGLGNASGTVNLVPLAANLQRNRARTSFRVDSYDGTRASVDFNHVFKPNVLALRANFVTQHEGFVRKPSGVDTIRYNFALKFQPYKYTTLRVNHFNYQSDGTRANSVTPRDAISYWKASGSPTWDPVTFTAKLNGAPVGTFTASATLPSYFRANNFMNRAGLAVDQAGVSTWTVQQTASGSNPSSANGNIRFVESSFDNTIKANQPLFSTWPGVTDQSLYDWESVNLSAINLTDERDQITTAELEQIFLKSDRQLLAAQVGFMMENAKRYNRNLFGSAAGAGIGSLLQIDVNERLLDGTPNPHFLRPYLGIAEPISVRDPFESQSVRAQLAYQLDYSRDTGWKRWLGQHSLVGYYEFKDSKSRVYRYRDVMTDDHSFLASGNPRGNQAAPAGATVARGMFRYYVGDNVGGNVDYAPTSLQPGTYPFTWFNGSTGRWVTENATLGEVATQDNSGGTRNRWTELKTKGAVLQSHWLQGRVVTTFGLRDDANYTKFGAASALTPDGLDFDYATMEGWAGDWLERSGRTKTAGVVVKPWSWLNLHYNKSNSFLPSTPSQNLLRQELPDPSGEGKDFGFSLNLFEGKLRIRANQYESKQINSPFGQSGTYAQRILSTDFVEFNNGSGPKLNTAVRAWTIADAQNHGVTLTEQQIQAKVYETLQLTPEDFDAFQRLPITDIADITGKGKEIEINYNPNRFWTVRANLAEQKAINSNLSPALLAWAEKRLPVWQTVRNPVTGALWWTTPFSSTQTPEQFYATSVNAPIKLDQALDGKSRAQVRKYRVNISTNFQLAGVTDHKILKDVNVGGALRWEDKGAIGYYGLQTFPAQITELDPNRPVWDKSRYYVDAFVAYRVRLFSKKVATKFQLNVRNLGENGRLQPVGALPDGTPHTFRIIDPQQFIFTATFDL